MTGEVEWAYLGQARVFEALAHFMSNYPIPNWGLLWILFGTVLYAVVFGKTRDYGISGVVLSLYLAMVSYMFEASFWVLFILVLALHMAIMVFKIIRG